jgi:enoyl-CoA hydratase
MFARENEKIYMEKENGIATIYINRPEKRNALSIDMWKKMIEMVDSCTEDDEVKVMIFRSTTETAFSAGADISEFETIRSTVDGVISYGELTSTLERKIAESPKPSIAMIQGFCVGGGCEIAVACDFRFSDETGKFGITPAKLGIVYDTAATKHLVDLVGPAHAKDILFTGRIFPAEEALQMGLINRIVATEELERETYTYARRICENAQLSVQASKKIIHRVRQGATKDNEEIKQLIAESVQSDEYKQRIRAFLNKGKA